MFILDSLSLTAAAKTTATKQQKLLQSATSLTSSVLKSHENGAYNLISLKVTPTAVTERTIKYDSCEMTTNKYLQLQQQKRPEPQQINKVVEQFMIQEKSSPSPHKIKEMIKNNNENFNDESTIENNTTIGDNTMPQEEQQNNKNENNDRKGSSSTGAEWGKAPATYNCNHKYSNCNDTNTTATTTTTTNINVCATASNTNITTTILKAPNVVNNADENNIRRVEEILLTNIKNNADLNTFALPPEPAATTPITLQNLNSSSVSPPFSICPTDATSIGMFFPLQKSKRSCDTNSDSVCISPTCDNDGIGGGGGNFCHNSTTKNNNNCYNKNNNSSNNNKNNVILSTNSFVTVECSPLTCENEREQETQKPTQNGYKNSGNAAAATTAITTTQNNTTSNTPTMAEFSTYMAEPEYFSLYSGIERIKSPIGNLNDKRVSTFDSPVDSVLENFEQFLMSVKLENQNLTQTIPECDDLIDLSDEPKSLPNNQNVNVIHSECSKLEGNEGALSTLHTDRFENSDSVQNKTQQTCLDDKKHVNNVENQCNFENLLYCDLNETLEEQNFLESKEILQLTTAESTQTEIEAVKTAKMIKISTKINGTKCLVVDDEVNETTAKTPVTCINVYSNFNNKFDDDDENRKNNNKKQQHETCAVEKRKESFQNQNSCCDRTVTEAKTTAVTKVPLEHVTTNKICSSSSIENISPQTQNKIEESHNQNQSVNTNNTAAVAARALNTSISCSTAKTPKHKRTDFAEHTNINHHSPVQQQQQFHEKRIRQDQFTSAYTLRDFAKCLKPSSDEDIIYTLNFTQNVNENEKEKLQKLNFNLNTQIPTSKSVSSTTKSIANCDFGKISENEVNLKQSQEVFNENNLYNKIFNSNSDLKADNGINHSLNDQSKGSKDSESESVLNCETIFKNQEFFKLKDTQFLEIENLSTPKFFNSTNQPGLDAQKADVVRENKAADKFQICSYSNQNSENIDNFDNELKSDCNEKIYTSEKSSQPLLYLTFVWPTKNEGQVVTTRRQGNEEQGEIEIEKQEEEEAQVVEEKKEYRLNQQYSNKTNNNNNSNIEKNVDDECNCNCKLARRVLERTYGTCNKKHVEDCHKEQQINLKEREKQENFYDKYDGNKELFEQRNLIHLRDKNQCLLHKTVTTKSEEFKNKNCLQKIFENQDKLQESEKNPKNINDKEIYENFPKSLESAFKFNKILPKCEKSVENFVKNSETEEKIPTSAKCVLQSENNFETKSLAIDINRNNPNLNITESVNNQDNGKNILNLNKSLKRLNETNQNTINKQIHATLNTKTKSNNHHHHQQLIEEQEDQLNLEEFEASQRLKRLLEQHQQFRIRYDTIPTTTTILPFDKQTNALTTTTTLSESLKTEIARHSKATLKGNLYIPNTNHEGVANRVATTATTTTTTTTAETKANKLQADCEITLERSLLLHANEHKPKIIEIKINPKEQKEKPIIKEEQQDVNEVKDDEEALKDIKKQEIGKRDEALEIKVLNNKELNESFNDKNINSPQQAYVSKKLVRLSLQTHQHSQLHSSPYGKLSITDKEQQQQQKIVIENLSNLRFPIENIDKTEISQKPSPSKLCNLNLQHIVKTKQLLQKEQEVKEEKKFITNFKKSCTPPPSEAELNEYKSAFVPTKPEIYKSIKPLTGTSGQLNTLKAIIPLIPATASLSEFDTQRFSDFLYLNHLNISLNNNTNNSYHFNNNNPTNCQTTHVLSTPQQEHQYQQYPLYTTNFVDPLHIPYCYDELFLNEASQNSKQREAFNATTNTKTTDFAAENGDTEIDDDLVSISSNNSSPCGCVNCQQQTQQEIDRVRDPRFTIEANVIPVLSLNETEALKLKQQQPQQQSFNMREVNGQLRGLLKKPNRPPPARKNRVVFDETRNEFFEADYIILIREDCAYDEEDEEPCTCGEHELVRLCCEEGCQCNYSTAPATTDDNRTPQSPKYAPPIEFVDEAALSPPDGYKDNGLKNTLGGALSGHIFGAQHLQQLQVIQRLQQQRAAMLAARNNSQLPPPPPPATGTPSVNQQQSTSLSSSPPSSTAAAVATTVASNNSMNQTAAIQQHSPDDDTQGVCTECAECAECAAKQLQQDAECNSPQCQEDLTVPLGVPAVALLPIHTSSPERRMTQKEIIAGEERPRYVLQAQYKSSPVSERRIVREATEDLAANSTGSPATSSSSVTAAASTTALSAGDDSDLLPPALPAKPGATSINNDLLDSEKPPPIPPKESSPTTQISGILKGGKLWKQDSISQQSDDQNNTTSEDEAGSTSNGTIKRSVRFVTEEISNDEVDGQSSNVDEDNQINELIPIKKHSTLFKNALRPNSAVQQLFPSTASHQTLTSEALRAFDESKRAGCLVSTLPGSAGDSDTLRRSMERNILRRSLIKKKAVKSDISLEERIKLLTCGIDEDNDESAQENGDDDNSKIEDSTDLSHRDSPAGEENPQKFSANGNNSDKSFSPNSSVSSSSSGSSAYKKITEIFNREKKNQEKIMEMEENPIVIIPQECRCPAAPDLGMGVQVPVVHTQIHRTPPRQTEPKRQFLSTLAPLTACVAGNKDDLSSYYTLAAAHHNQAAQNAHAAEYNLAAMMVGEQNSSGLSQSTGDEVRKVAPDVIAGTPGQEQQDELAAFAQQEANRTDKIKKRYGNEPVNSKENKEINSDDDEGNDYGFNKRPSVRGIKPKFSSTNEILQQMQDQLSQQMPSVAHSQPLPQPMKSYTLPKQSSASAMTKQLSQQQPSPQNVPHPVVANSQQQLPQQQQMCSAVAQPAAMQMPANAAIAQQQTEQRTWSFYSETGAGGEQQRLPVESAAAAMQQTYYQTLPAGAMFRHTMIHQHQQHGPEEAMLYAQNCQAMATTIEPQPHYGHYARSPTRRPESPPPLRNYHQTMVLIPYNAETYSQFAASSMDPKVAHIQRQNILEYQQVGEMTQVTQQTIRVPIGYALPGMQLHVVAGRGHAAQYATAAAAQTHHHQHQRIMTQRYQFAQEASLAGFSERGVPEGAAAVSHSDCTNSGMVSPTTGQQIAMQQQQQQQQQQQLQQGAQMAQQQVNCQQQQQQQQQPQPQTQNNMQSAAQGSVYYAMNV